MTKSELAAEMNEILNSAKSAETKKCNSLIKALELLNKAAAMYDDITEPDSSEKITKIMENISQNLKES